VIDNSCSIATFELSGHFYFRCSELEMGDSSSSYIVAGTFITAMMHDSYEVTISLLFTRSSSVPERKPKDVLCANCTMWF